MKKNVDFNEEEKKAINEVNEAKPGKTKTRAIENFGNFIENNFQDEETKKAFAMFQSLLNSGVSPIQIQNALASVGNLDISIKNFFSKKDLEVVDFAKKSSGVQQGTSVVLSNGQKYHVKTYEGHKSERLDPREFFVYKVLELTGFGQQVEFIPAIKSKSADGFYIATLDAAYTKHKNTREKTFKTATKYENELELSGVQKEDLKNAFYDILSTRLEDKRFATECVALELLDKNFGLTDTFTNSGNYGFVEIKFTEKCDSKEQEEQKNYATKMKPKLIDLRIAEYFGKDDKTFTGRIRAERLEEIENDAKKLISVGKTAFYEKNAQSNKSKLGINEAINQAHSFVQQEIINKTNQNLLVDNAEGKLEEYVKTVSANFNRIEQDLSSLSK